MPDLFWRGRLRRQAKKITLSLPNLPEDLDDNVFIALATQAAQADKASGAYDEFMFSEDGYDKMPYEDSVDEFLALQIERTPERAGRAELPHLLRLEYFNKLVEDRKRAADDAQTEVEAAAALIGEEAEVLSGEREGEDGGKWKGVAPDTLTKSKHASRRIMSWLIFLIVAGVDAVVVFFSLYQITPTDEEALYFTPPAVGVQVLFPHLVGKAISQYRSKQGDHKRDLFVAWGVGISWLVYIAGMTFLRYQLLQAPYFKNYGEDMPLGLSIATFIISLFILVGLGSWIMIRAMSENPHEGKYSRLRYSYLAKKRKLRRKLRELNQAEALVAGEEKALEEVRKQWKNRAEKYTQVGEIAKSTYRRALVNQVGTPDFTTTYLPKDKFSFKRTTRKDSNDYTR